MLPEGDYILHEVSAPNGYIKAADKISALVKCTEELIMGNREFIKAQQTTLKAIKNIKNGKLPKLRNF